MLATAVAIPTLTAFAVLALPDGLDLQRHQRLGAQQAARRFGRIGLQHTFAGESLGGERFE